MLSSLDLVMWVFNGERTLTAVLDQINKVIPKDVVGQKIVVDDGSSDQSRAIATFMGWTVISNDGKGISDAANTALKHVKSPVFCSFEQDIVLSPKWWETIPKMLTSEPIICVNRNIAVASGIRVPSGSKTLRDIGIFESNRFRTKETPIDFSIDEHRFGMSLDNTCYNTSVMKQIGGFPKVKGGAGVDRLLVQSLLDNGFRWHVNYDVCSVHMRSGVWDELKHYYWYGKCQKQIDASFFAYLGLVGRAAFSPIRGLDITVKQRNWRCAFVYPAIRISSLVGALMENM